jgi:lipoprotein-releasing system ATP-binding protein
MILSIQGLTKSYEQKPIFSNFNLELEDRSSLCIQGRSGSGKTTLLNLIAGFDRNYLGSISVMGQQLSSLTEAELDLYRQNVVAISCQYHNLLNEFTVEENIAMPLLIKGCSYQDAIVKARNLLAELDLMRYNNSDIRDLSGGEKQRISILRSIISKPKLLLLDEPTGALDLNTRDRVLGFLQDLNISKIIVSHDPSVAQAISGKLLQLP